MIPIILLSFISIYIFIERYIYIKKSAAPGNSMINKILSEAAGRKYESALAHARKDTTSFGRIFESGLIHADKPAKEVEGYMESAANLEMLLWRKIWAISVYSRRCPDVRVYRYDCRCNKNILQHFPCRTISALA